MDSLQLGITGFNGENHQNESKQELSNFFYAIPDFLSEMSKHLDMRSLHCFSFTSKKYNNLIRNPFFPAHQWIFQSPYIKKREETEKEKLIDYSSSKPTILQKDFPAVMKRYVDRNYLEPISTRVSFFPPHEWNKTIVENLPLAVSQTKHPGLLRALLNSYKRQDRFKAQDTETQQQGLEFAKAYARDQNPEMREVAIDCVLDAYCNGCFGLNPKDPQIQAEGLKLAKAYANEGSEAAITFLLNAYSIGYFGLKSQDPITRMEGFELAEAYGDKGSDAAIKFLLQNCCYSRISGKVELEVTKKYADQENEYAIQHLLIIYQGVTFANGQLHPIHSPLLNTQDPKVQKEGLELAKAYANGGSEKAILSLLDAYNHAFFGLDDQNPMVQEEGLKLAKTYADKGSETAIAYLLNSYKRGYFGLNHQEPQIQNEGLELAKDYANKESEAAVEYLLNFYHWSKDPEIQKEGLKFLKVCADQQSETAFKYISWLKTGGFGLKDEDAKVTSQKMLKDYADKQSEKAIFYLLDPHRYNLNSAYLAQPYANKNSKSALNFLAGFLG